MPSSTPLFGQAPAAPPLVARYRADADRIIDAALADSAAWHRVAELTDTFGARFSGTPALERSIDWMLDQLRRDGLANARGEPAMVPHWVRGRESAELVRPRRRRMAMLGLGGSVGTPAGGITAPVLVVSSFEELARRGEGEADIGPLLAAGVPGAGLDVDGSRYFSFHHTDADTPDKLDPKEVAPCVATFAVWAYVLADMPERPPHAAATPAAGTR